MRSTGPDSLRALRRHRVPSWWSDAKLGIFVHWTPASVPGWAPTHTGIGELLASGRADALAESPYTEWYQNSLRFPDSSVARHHRETYGDRPYESFAADFDAGLAQWDPHAWAAAFRDAGARYVVLVAKHHDGYCLWPSDVVNPRRSGWHTSRDVVGELADAVRAVGLRFGLYYSGGLDWTFEDRPLGSVADVVAAMPRADYPAYATAQVRELIERYRPSVLWNDITWPTDRSSMFELFAEYYRAVPDGLVNDRWMPWSPAMSTVRLAAVRRLIDASATRSARTAHGMVPPRPPHFDVRTPEYVTFEEVQRQPWECVRGIDRSFGYNRVSRPEHFLARDELLSMLAEITSAGGNLLLNVGPRGEDAQIPSEQLDRLAWLGEWARGAGASVFGSRPWVRAADGAPDGAQLRYWTRDDSLFVAIDAPGVEVCTVPGVTATPATTVSDPNGAPMRWATTPAGLRVETPGPDTTGPRVLRIDHAEACRVN